MRFSRCSFFVVLVIVRSCFPQDDGGSLVDDYLLEFERLSQSESLALANRNDKRFSIAFEQEVNALIDFNWNFDILISDAFAQKLVSRISVAGAPGIVGSLAPLLPWAFPEGTPQKAPASSPHSAECYSKYIFFRCLTDRRFKNQYLYMLLWSRRFIEKSGDAGQRYELALLSAHLKSPGAFENENFWTSLLQMFIITELFGYKSDDAFPTTRESATSWSDGLHKWVITQKFSLSSSGTRWQSVGLRDSKAPGIDLVPMNLPASPLQDTLDWPFERIRDWGEQ